MITDDTKLQGAIKNEIRARISKQRQRAGMRMRNTSLPGLE